MIPLAAMQISLDSLFKTSELHLLYSTHHERPKQTSPLKGNLMYLLTNNTDSCTNKQPSCAALSTNGKTYSCTKEQTRHE